MPDGGAIEVLVIDGMSNDGTRELVQRLASGNSCIRLIDNPKKIVSTGLNEGIRAARGEIIVRMDAHSEYAADYVRQCVDTLKRTGADNVGGPWIAQGKTYMQCAVAAAFASPLVFGGAAAHRADYEGSLDTVYLGCWRRELFDQVGGFDEELVRNQDDEHNLRIKLAGGVIWQSPSIRSWYRPRQSLVSVFRQYMQYGYWKVRVIQKRRQPASFRHLVPGTFVFVFGALLVLSLLSHWFFWMWIVLTVSYLGYSLAVSVLTAARNGWTYFLVLPAVIACYHVGYGYGFIRGVLDFVIRRKGAASSFTSLTRDSKDNILEVREESNQNRRAVDPIATEATQNSVDR